MTETDADASPGERTQPLTFGQRARLLSNCWPFVAVLALTGAFLIVLVGRFHIYERPPLLFYAVMGAALLLTGYDAAVCLWDFISGTAFVRDDVLQRSWTSKRPGGSQCYGRFQQLGRMRMSKNAHFREAVTGAHHRVVYSPVSRIVWTVEPYVNPPGSGLDRFRAKP